MSELHHECGVVAIYHLASGPTSPLCPAQGRDEVSRLMPRMLLDVQNRGQLSAGIATYNPLRSRLLDVYKKLGTVSEVFRLGHRGKSENIMRDFAGRAAIGHVRYATCGEDDVDFAQPFERRHIQKGKWFAFAFNGQLANYAALRKSLLAVDDHHLSCDTDTEVILHEIGRELSVTPRPSLIEVVRNLAVKFDGAYSLALLNAEGELLIARDPLGVKPMCYAVEGALLAAASESVALVNLGFAPESIKSLAPGEAITVVDDKISVERFADSPRQAHCFFEWVYFANVASTMDDRSVYLARTALGQELARMETVPPGDDLVVVPVPDTSKAAADAMAFALGIPSVEGLIRNRYAGRTFIEGGGSREAKAAAKYTPLCEVLEGKRVLLVEDSIVRSTTMRVLLKRIREAGRAKEIHVRVACPPIIAPCFYGIDMSRIRELFAPPFMERGLGEEEAYAAMARELGADSLRYLPVDAIARAVGKSSQQLCRACITGEYPTPWGQKLYQLAVDNYAADADGAGRTYEAAALG